MNNAYWQVRIDSRLRPLIEAIARDEEREPAQVVRRLLDRALALHGATRLTTDISDAGQTTASGRGG